MGSDDKDKNSEGKTKGKKDIIQQKEDEIVANTLCELSKTVDTSIINKILKEKAERICAVQIWLREGRQTNLNRDREVQEYHKGLIICDDILNLQDDIALKKLAKLQANNFWLLRGAIEDDNQERMNNDYYDAKRYIGYLIVESIIEGCKNNKLDPQDCFVTIEKEYIEYLKCLSLEEFIRTQAYFQWLHSHEVIYDNELNRMNRDYFSSLGCIRNTMWNCKQKQTDKCIGKSKFLDLLKENILHGKSKIDKSELTIIKKAKAFTCQRLNYNRYQTLDEFVDIFYSVLEKTLNNTQLLDNEIDQIEDLIRYMYAENHIPNMAEYLLRCFLCTYIPIEKHNQIRDEYEKKSCQYFNYDHYKFINKKCSLNFKEL